MSDHDAYLFRAYTADDIPFIQSSWGRSYYEGQPGNKQLSSTEFHDRHRPIRERILANPKATAIVCAAKTDPTTILGWILVEKPNENPFILCHYLYVKATFQGNNLGRELIKMALPIRPVLYTHLTLKAKRTIRENFRAEKNDFSRWYFCPHLI